MFSLTVCLRPHVNKMNVVLVHLNWARRTSWGCWDVWNDIGFDIKAQAIWGRARYLSVIEASHNIESLGMSREQTFCFFETQIKMQDNIASMSLTIPIGNFQPRM